MIFSNWRFLQKTNKQIKFYYYETCFSLFFGGNWRHQKDISKLSGLYYAAVTDCYIELQYKVHSPKYMQYCTMVVYMPSSFGLLACITCFIISWERNDCFFARLGVLFLFEKKCQFVDFLRFANSSFLSQLEINNVIQQPTA